jgi:hypothetical protein
MNMVHANRKNLADLFPFLIDWKPAIRSIMDEAALKFMRL